MLHKLLLEKEPAGRIMTRVGRGWFDGTPRAIYSLNGVSIMNWLPDGPRWPKDNGMEITELEWETAVCYLVQNLEMETWRQVSAMIQEKGKRWYVGEGQHLGRTVRSLLMKAGFKWGAVCMQANWFRLLEEGARRIYFASVELLE